MGTRVHPRIGGDQEHSTALNGELRIRSTPTSAGRTRPPYKPFPSSGPNPKRLRNRPGRATRRPAPAHWVRAAAWGRALQQGYVVLPLPADTGVAVCSSSQRAAAVTVGKNWPSSLLWRANTGVGRSPGADGDISVRS